MPRCTAQLPSRWQPCNNAVASKVTALVLQCSAASKSYRQQARQTTAAMPPAGLGAKLVIVIGARPQINKAMRESGVEPRYEHGYRVTDAASLQAAIRAAGQARMEVESRLSKARAFGAGLCSMFLCVCENRMLQVGQTRLLSLQGPMVTMVRRHARSGGEGPQAASQQQQQQQQQHYGPALTTVSGNYVAAKRKGVVGGVDYQLTGVVRFVQVGRVCWLRKVFCV